MLHLTKRENGTKKKKKDGLDRKRDNWKENRLGSIGRWGGGGKKTAANEREERVHGARVRATSLFHLLIAGLFPVGHSFRASAIIISSERDTAISLDSASRLHHLCAQTQTTRCFASVSSAWKDPQCRQSLVVPASAAFSFLDHNNKKTEKTSKIYQTPSLHSFFFL